jgi:glycosyltransferase involved in cell wall biosynthesis
VLKVSVVIPTWNRADLLARTIDKIENQTLSRDHYEVLVIDNGSNDRTQSVLDQLSRKFSNLKSFSQLKRGAAATRNVGIRAATAGLVLFIDDDIPT